MLEALFSSIESKEQPFKASVEYVVSSVKFWHSVADNKGNISEASFSFVPPNMFGGRDAFGKAMRELRDKVGSEETKLITRNQDKQLNLEDDSFREIVNYALDGAGEVKLKSGKKTVFSSSKGKKTSDVEDSQPISHAEDKESFAKNLINKLFKR